MSVVFTLVRPFGATATTSYLSRLVFCVGLAGLSHSLLSVCLNMLLLTVVRTSNRSVAQFAKPGSSMHFLKCGDIVGYHLSMYVLMISFRLSFRCHVVPAFKAEADAPAKAWHSLHSWQWEGPWPRPIRGQGLTKVRLTQVKGKGRKQRGFHTFLLHESSRQRISGPQLKHNTVSAVHPCCMSTRTLRGMKNLLDVLILILLLLKQTNRTCSPHDVWRVDS